MRLDASFFFYRATIIHYGTYVVNGGIGATYAQTTASGDTVFATLHGISTLRSRVVITGL